MEFFGDVYNGIVVYTGLFLCRFSLLSMVCDGGWKLGGGLMCANMLVAWHSCAGSTLLGVLEASIEHELHSVVW